MCFASSVETIVTESSGGISLVLMHGRTPFCSRCVVCDDSTKDVVGYLQLAESASGEHACRTFRNLAWQPGCVRSLHFYAIRAGPTVVFVLSMSLNITRAIKGLFGRELAHDNKMSTSRQTINFRRSLPLSRPSLTVRPAHTIPTEREPSLHRASYNDQY